MSECVSFARQTQQGRPVPVQGVMILSVHYLKTVKRPGRHVKLAAGAVSAQACPPFIQQIVKIKPVKLAKKYPILTHSEFKTPSFRKMLPC